MLFLLPAREQSGGPARSFFPCPRRLRRQTSNRDRSRSRRVPPDRRGPSWPLPQLDEIAERIRGLARDAKFLVRAAHRPEVTPGAGTLVGSGGEKTELDCAVDDLERLNAGASRLRKQGNGTDPVAAGRGAEEEPCLRDRPARDLLDGRRVQDRLQRCATADDQVVCRAVLARLVIRNPQHARVSMLLDKIDRAAQPEPAVDQHFVTAAVRIAVGAERQPERQLEIAGGPLPALFAGLAKPPPQIACDDGNLFAPDTVDRGRQLLLV